MNAVERGFSLLELLVVLAVVGLALTVTPPLLARGRAVLELRTVVRQVVVDLRAARAAAIDGRRTVEVTVEGANRLLASGAAVDHAFAAGVSLAIDGAGAVQFFSDGSSSGGTIRLRQADATRSVRVSALSGSVHHD